MLNKKNSFVKKQEMLNNNIEYNCYFIKATELRKITGLSVKDIDDILMTSGNLPISKFKKVIHGINQTYYVFPIELIIAYFFEAETDILCKDCILNTSL